MNTCFCFSILYGFCLNVRPTRKWFVMQAFVPVLCETKLNVAIIIIFLSNINLSTTYISSSIYIYMHIQGYS
jgi:hypothetical protein